MFGSLTLFNLFRWPNSSGGYREFTKWTTEMDLIILNAMVEEARRGSRIDDSWTTLGYTNVVMTLHTQGWIIDY